MVAKTGATPFRAVDASAGDGTGLDVKKSPPNSDRRNLEVNEPMLPPLGRDLKSADDSSGT